MTELLFGAAGLIFLGYIIGKLFKKFNPFLMVFGAIIILSFYPVFMQMEYRDLATICFVVGIILNFERPVTKFKYWVSDLFGTISFRRAKAGYINDIEKQKQQAEDELYRQKQEVEEELRRQKRQAEQDIERQRKEAEEAIRKEAEDLRREQERARSSQNNSSSSNGKSQSEQSRSQSNNSESGHLNPQYFPDACEILGKGQGCSLKEYKVAYMQLIKLYHPDKIAGLSGARKTQAENEAKQINSAWDTIKKKLK